MLIISRRPGERIVIGGDVVVSVLESSAGQVRVGVDAPREIPVLREELLDRPRAGTRPARIAAGR